MPDRKDEDCDGRIDEDVDATRADCPCGLRIIEGTRGNDVLHGTTGRDCIFGYGGNDIITGEGGDDVIFGGPGDDRIVTGKGRPFVRAGAGNDMVDSSFSSTSTVQGEAGQDTLKGGSGIDLLFGGDDNDVLNGGGGGDVLNGGGCHDMLIGGPGSDVGTGGKDFDACETELSTECEKSGTTRVLCLADANCAATERCALNSGFCVPRTAALCGSNANTCTVIKAVDDTCNGVDDDCDGVIDDDYVAHTTTCGQGSCGATGMTMCVAGVVQDSCHMGSPLPGNDATCNAMDDDCDGHVDEGFVSAATSCGMGGCASTGATSCVGGSVVDSCHAGTPGAPTDTTCNGQDDDCDGAIDEDFVPAVTNCGQGVCANTGMSSCVAGVLDNSCVPGLPTAEVDDTCNGIDEDCSGTADENFAGHPTTCGFAACTRNGAVSCVSGHEVDTCHVDCEGQCNDGAEDDGDGAVDCADSDCANAVGCMKRSFGSPCVNDSQCDALGSEGICATSFPGGYCTRPCGAGCPTGTQCLGGVACVVSCGPGNHCGRAGFVCGSSAALPPDPWCHPTCQFSCPNGAACDVATDLCP